MTIGKQPNLHDGKSMCMKSIINTTDAVFLEYKSLIQVRNRVWLSLHTNSNTDPLP